MKLHKIENALIDDELLTPKAVAQLSDNELRTIYTIFYGSIPEER